MASIMHKANKSIYTLTKALNGKISEQVAEKWLHVNILSAMAGIRQ